MRGICIRIMVLMVLLSFCSIVIGCGETMGGIGKDATRMGRGIRTIFVKDGSE